MKAIPKHVRMTKAKMIRLGYRKDPVSKQALAAIAITFAIFIPGWIWVCSKFITIENMRALEQWLNGVFK